MHGNCCCAIYLVFVQNKMCVSMVYKQNISLQTPKKIHLNIIHICNCKEIMKNCFRMLVNMLNGNYLNYILCSISIFQIITKTDSFSF